MIVHIGIRLILRILGFVLLLLLLIAIAVYAVWYVPKIGTMSSVRKVSDYEGSNLYQMDYTADYKLDEILEAGAGDTVRNAERQCRSCSKKRDIRRT